MTSPIRRMRLADVPQVHAIEKQCFQTPWSLDALTSEMTTNPLARYLVYELDGRIVGFAGVHLVLDEGHITNIAVSPDHRQQGIGGQLSRALMQYAASLGCRYLTLEVRQSNTAAQALYKRLGFVKVFVRKRYYEDNGEDALLMVCDKLPDAQADFTEEETLFTD